MTARWVILDASLALLAVSIYVGVRVYDWYVRRQDAREWARLRRERDDVEARLAETTREGQ